MNGLQGELLRYEGNRVYEELFNFISKCWDAAEVPTQTQQKDAKIVAIYKRKGDKAEFGKKQSNLAAIIWRETLCAPPTSKALEQVSESVLPEFQCSFCKDRSTTDMTLALRQIQEKCREQHKELFAVFVDLCKVFETVNSLFLWQVLARLSCPARLVEAIKAFHTEMYAPVSTAGDVSEPFQVLAGVKQGCVLAPVLFNLLSLWYLMCSVQTWTES